MSVQHAMAETNGIDLAVLVGRPGVDAVGVGIVEEECVISGHLADVLAEAEDGGNVSLAVHHAAGTDGVADALVHTIFEGYIDVVLVRFQPADASAVDDVVGSLKCLAAIRGGGDPGRQAVGLDILAAEFCHHVEVLRIDVVKREVSVPQFGNAQDVTKKSAGESEAASTDECDFDRHNESPENCFNRSSDEGRTF